MLLGYFSRQYSCLIVTYKSNDLNLVNLNFDLESSELIVIFIFLPNLSGNCKFLKLRVCALLLYPLFGVVWRHLILSTI